MWTGHRYICVPHILTPPATSLPTPSLWVVPEHQLWVPCFKHRTCTGHLSADGWIRKLWYLYGMVLIWCYGILLSYKKECTWVSSNEVDETGAHYTEWSKSERKRQILHINAYIWNLEGWYQWSYMQGSKGDTEVKNRILDSEGEGEGGMTWENSFETCTFSRVK